MVIRNPRSRLLLLLYEVVDSKVNRDKESELDKQIREARKDNKYHLVQNYNNDLIRRSLKSQNNQNRLNIKDHKANLHFENISKKIEEKNRKKIAQMIGRVGHNQMKSLGTHKRHDELEIDIDNQSESIDKLGTKPEKTSNFSYKAHTVSSNITPNSNISFSTNKSNRGATNKDKFQDQVITENPNKLLIKNSLIQRLKKRNTSKNSNRESFSKEGLTQKPAKPVKGSIGGENKYLHQAEERILHLTLTGAKHNTNLVQINNYINKLHREDVDQAGVSDNRSHRQSANSNSSQAPSNKPRITRKQDNIIKDLDVQANKVRKEPVNPLKPQSRLAQPILANLQNKNVLTLTQNLLQKRNRNE